MLVPKDYSLDTGNQLIDTCFIIQALGGLFFYHYNGLDAILVSYILSIFLEGSKKR